ncbi:unnamed protein product [Heterobilharzia americana]|nr:unnamed protein product [Heterobilharzia americana]
MGGAISTVLCQPLDVIKTRLQTKVVLGLPPLGVRQAISQIYTNDLAIGGRITSVSHVLEVCGRLRNFWTGTYPSLWRCVPGIGGYFMCLDILQDVTTRWDFLTTTTYTPTTAVRSFLLAFTARGIVAFCLDPFVVIKTQLESGLYAEDRRSMLRTFRRVYSSAKWKGLYSGVWASIMRDCPYSGLYLATYTSLLHYTGLYSPFQKNTDKSFLCISGCAALAACFATTITHPADLIRAHRQLLIREIFYEKLTNQNSIYQNKNFNKPTLFHVLESTYQNYGIKGLCQGLSLRLLRRTTFGVVSWTLYEFFV